MGEVDLADLIRNFKNAILGGGGGFVAYLYRYAMIRREDKTAKLDWVTFLINGIVGAFMAFALGDLIPDDLTGRDGFVGLIGVVGFSLMHVIESKFADKVIGKLLKIFD